MKKVVLIFSLLTAIFTYVSCSKSDPAPADPCAGVTIGVTAAVTNTAPGQSNGVITATATGSSGLTYSMNGGTFQSSGTFSGLAAGSYTISAKNANGCTGSAQFVVGTINPCTGVTITVTGTVANATIANNDGSLTVAATGGTTFTYSINGSTFQSANVFSNLAAGTYTVTAKNETGCTGTAPFTITNPCTGVNITLTATVTTTAAGQSNGSINATATGSTGFTYSLNSGAFQASGLFSNLAAGAYTLTAKNSNGCTGSAQFTVSVTNVCSGVTITVNSTTTAATPCTTNGGISVSVTGGNAPYTYNLNGGAFQSSGIFNNLGAGNYNIIVMDANGCMQSATATVAVGTAGPLFNAVKQVLATNCALSGCHIGPNPQNGLDWTDNCTIAANAARIKARAVDGNPSFMPPYPYSQLSATDKQKIVNWVNAGGQITN